GCYVDSIQYGGKEVPDSVIELWPGASLEITIGSDGGKAQGNVVDKDDHPLEDAVVALIPADGKGAVHSVKSGPGGAFQIKAVPPGDYKLMAWDDVARDDLENPEFIKRFENQATAIKLSPSGTAAVSVRVIAQE